MKIHYAILLLATAACGKNGGDRTEVELCDGHTKVEVEGQLPESRAGGQAVADQLMAQWKLSNPGRPWEEAVKVAHPRIPPPADNSDVVEGGQHASQTYGRYSQRDVLTWKSETERLVLTGARVFHSGDELGSTIAVSCDMCHPDAANTHPETYPKFQVQMGRVALLRDMINWCLQHPVRAPAMADDDPRLRAMEAYILAQRKGSVLDYGRH